MINKVTLALLDCNKEKSFQWQQFATKLGITKILEVDALGELEGESELILIDGDIEGFADLELFYESAKDQEKVELVTLETNTGQELLLLDRDFLCTEEGKLDSFYLDGFVRAGVTFLKSTEVFDADCHFFPQALKQSWEDFLKLKSCLLLDRDGIINVDRGYVHKWEEIEFFNETIELIREANEQSWPVFILTNQSGIGRGKYQEKDVELLHKKMADFFNEKGVSITDWIYSPYHEEGQGKYRFQSHSRKPKPGMLLALEEKWPIDRRKSVMIGDKNSDYFQVIGLKTILLFGKYKPDDSRATLIKDISEARDHVFNL